MPDQVTYDEKGNPIGTSGRPPPPQAPSLMSSAPSAVGTLLLGSKIGDWIGSLGKSSAPASAGGSLPAGMEVLGTNMDGSPMVLPSNVTVPGAASSFGAPDMLAIAAALKGGTGLYQDFTHANKHNIGGGALHGAETGGGIGYEIGGPWGGAIGAGIGGLTGGISQLFGSGKGKEQQQRDAMRKDWQKKGLVDANWKINLPNGRSFDIGGDGKDWQGHSATFDYQNPMNHQGIQWLNPVALILSGGDRKQADEWVRNFTNQFSANGTASLADFRDNVQGLYNKMGLKPSQVTQALADMKAKGIISDPEFSSFSAGLNSLRTGGALPNLPAYTPPTMGGTTAAPAAPGAAPASNAPSPGMPGPSPTGPIMSNLPKMAPLPADPLAAIRQRGLAPTTPDKNGTAALPQYASLVGAPVAANGQTMFDRLKGIYAPS